MLGATLFGATLRLANKFISRPCAKGMPAAQKAGNKGCPFPNDGFVTFRNLPPHRRIMRAVVQ